MTSTQRGQAQVDTCGWGEGHKLHVDVHTEIRAHWCHPEFFSCKEVGIFCTSIWSLDEKKCKFLINI